MNKFVGHSFDNIIQKPRDFYATCSNDSLKNKEPFHFQWQRQQLY